MRRRNYRRNKCVKRKSNKKRCDKRYKRRKSRRKYRRKRKSYRRKRKGKYKRKRKRKYKRKRRYKKFRFNLEAERRKCAKQVNRKYKAYLKSKRRRPPSGPKRGLSGYFQQKKHQRKCKKCDTLRRQIGCGKIYNVDPYCKQCLTILGKCGNPKKNIRPLPKIPSRRSRRSSSYYDRPPSRLAPKVPTRYI